MLRLFVPLCGTVLLLGGCASNRSGCEQAVAAVLDDFHDAAAKADEERYFAHFAPEGVFLGTDATERWDLPAFRAFAHPHFSKGKGWTYVPRDRHVDVRGDFAWFDELLDNKGLGETRGSGALRRIDGEWKLLQYNLTIPVPNEKADAVVALIRAQQSSGGDPEQDR